MWINPRHKARTMAMQVLFLWDAQGQDDEVMARQVLADASDDADLRMEALGMAKGAWEQREVSDRWIEKVAPQWPTHRQPPVDRNLLRLAVWELTNTATAPKIIIDEAIELARHFSTTQSAAFVNGVLDSVLKEHREMTGKTEGA